MLRKCAAVLAVVSCLTGATSIRAESGPVGRYLMNEPISLFELGMLKLETSALRWVTQGELDEMEAEYEARGVFFSVRYDWDENRIYVQGHIIEFEGDTATQKLLCNKLIKLISDMAGVDPKTGEVFSELTGGYSLFAGEFAHMGYSTQTEPEDYRTRLDKIFVIKGFVGRKPMRCIRALLSNKVYFEE